MVTASNLVYSISAVRRILGLDLEVEVNIREFHKVIWVHVLGDRPTFISKRVFKEHFVMWRKAAARSLSVTRDIAMSNVFAVRNEGKGNRYTVQLSLGSLLCNCDDFKNQAQFFGRACCKHGYAVLSYLGFDSLSAYILHCTNYEREVA